jgi:polyribonucleotide nucleotidyltransferase
MRKAIEKPRPELSPYAPRIIIETIPVEKIGEVIGPKGKIINEIIARTETQIDIEDDGRVLISATSGEAADKALKMIRDIVSPPQLEIGQEFEGTVVKTTDFGAFVNIMPGKDGLVHISKMSVLTGGKRVGKVEDVLNVGDRIPVRINEIRPDGKLNLVPSDAAAGNGEAAPAEQETVVGAE